jgi:membrane fusion protein (multidrug efflux system)
MPMKRVLSCSIAALSLILTGVATANQAQERPESPVRGVVKPVDQAAISGDLAARITELPLKEGQAFRKGELLAAFDCRRHKSEAQAAEAAHREARIAHESQIYLQRNQAGSRYDIETSKARADKAGAEAASLAVRLDQCRITAPFNGRIAELGVNVHETPAPGKPFLTIINDSTLEVELIVPSAWLGWLKQGTAFTFLVDETGGRYSSHIARIGAAVDPVSQTIKVVGRLDSPDGRVMAGMSGSASFESGL